MNLHKAMSNPISEPTANDPATSHSPYESVSQAARELREAASGKVHDAVHKAKDKSSEIKDRATESARHLCESASEKAHTLKENATVQAKHLQATASEQWDGTRVKAKEIHITAEDYIRQHPTKCVLGALGIGFLVGLLVRR